MSYAGTVTASNDPDWTVVLDEEVLGSEQTVYLEKTATDNENDKYTFVASDLLAQDKEVVIPFADAETSSTIDPLKVILYILNAVK